MGKIGGSLWVKNLLLKTTPPPPEKLSYPHKIRVFALFVLLALVFAFAGCTDSTADPPANNNPPAVTNTYTETVNNFTWTVQYSSNKVLSIYASNTENDRSSSYWEFSRRYHGDSNLAVKHTVILSGSPLGDGWYLIEQTESYIMSASSVADYERVKQTYPSCTQDSVSFDITLSERITRYEEKIIFSLPS